MPARYCYAALTLSLTLPVAAAAAAAKTPAPLETELHNLIAGLRAAEADAGAERAKAALAVPADATSARRAALAEQTRRRLAEVDRRAAGKVADLLGALPGRQVLAVVTVADVVPVGGGAADRPLAGHAVAAVSYADLPVPADIAAARRKRLAALTAGWEKAVHEAQANVRRHRVYGPGAQRLARCHERGQKLIAISS